MTFSARLARTSRAWGLRWRDQPWVTKLAILLIALAILPLVIVSAYSYNAARDELLAATHAQTLQRARGTAAVLDRYLNDFVADVRTIAALSTTVRLLQDPRNGTLLEELENSLQQVQDTYGFDTVYVADHTGLTLAASDARFKNRPLIASPSFLQAIAGQAGVGQVRYEPVEQRMFLQVFAPVRLPGGKVIGAALGRITLTEVDHIIAGDSNFGGRGEYGVLWDDLGIRLSSPAHRELTFKPLAPLPPHIAGAMEAEGRLGPGTASLLAESGNADAALERSKWLLFDPTSEPNVRLERPGEPAVQVEIVPMRNKRWLYGIFTPEPEILATLDRQTRRNLLIALATALLSTIVAFGAARWLAHPLRHMGETAHAIAGGELTRRVGLKQRDEIGQLGAAFDAMADAVAAKDAQLRRHADELERKVEERTAALQASEAELRALFFAIPDLIFRLDASGRIVNVMSATHDEVIPGSDQLVGRLLTDVLPAPLGRRATSAFDAALSSREPQVFEYMLNVGARSRYFEARLVVSGPDDVLGILRDITARKRSEERFQFLAQASTVLVSSLDYQGTLNRLANLTVPFLADACEVHATHEGEAGHLAVASMHPEKEILVREVQTRYPGSHRDGGPSTAVAGVRESTLVSDVDDAQLVRIAKDAEHLHLLRRLAPSSLMVVPLDARGSTVGAMTFMRFGPERHYDAEDLALAEDLARRAAIAVDNARLYRELQDLNRIKDEFLGTVSHELRTPLNAMLGWARLLQAKSLGREQVDRAIETIERNARIQSQLIDDLLDVSRMISGKLRLEIQPITLRAVIEAAIDAVGPASHAKQVDIELLPIADERQVWADPNRLQQVIWNLLANSIKFTPAGGRVTVSVTRTDTEASIVVRDTGAGIRSDFLPFVFDRFRQADSTTTRAHGGLGLGLAIVRHLVELHGGTVEADSHGEGQGAIFTVRMPVRARATAPPGRRSMMDAEVREAPQDNGGLGQVAVLVVDDEVDTRELLKATLEAYGARVSSASSADEAICALGEAHYDVLIADIGMPGEDGYGLMERLRRGDGGGNTDIPAVALTAYVGDHNRARALAAGFQVHLAKPVDPTELAIAIAGLAGK